MAFIECQSLPTHLRVLGLIAGGRRLRADEMVLDGEWNYFRFDDDYEWRELVSARLVSGLMRRQLIEGTRYFRLTESGERALLTHG